MSTTAWFASLPLEERKALLAELHCLRLVLDGSPDGQRAVVSSSKTRADLVLGLVRALDEDHHAVKDIEHVCEV